MKRSQFVSEGTLNRILQKASNLWQQREFNLAIDQWSRANRLDPANIKILIDLGHASGLRFNYANAHEFFDRAIRLSSDKSETLALVAEKARDFASPTVAEYYFKNAISQPEVSAETLISFADFLSRQRRLPDAKQIIERTLDSVPGYPPALLLKARFHRQEGEFEDAEALVRMILVHGSSETRIPALYELGTVLDRLGDYDAAISAILQAKALQDNIAAPHKIALASVRGRLKLLRETLSPSIIEKWLRTIGDLKPRQRIALLCGHPRSGTTLLEQVLDSHPDIVSLEETEIFHDEAFLPLTRSFSQNEPILSILESAITPIIQQSRENYLRVAQLFIGSDLGTRLLVDKNPSLTFLIPHFVRIFPEAKFLVAVRDPRDVCLSCFMQPILPLGQVSSAYVRFEDTVSEYMELMGMYLAARGGIESISHVVRYERMIDDIETTTREITQFLDIPWNNKLLRYDMHAQQKTIRSPTYSDVTKPLFKTAIGRWKHYEKYFSSQFERLLPIVKELGYPM